MRILCYLFVLIISISVVQAFEFNLGDYRVSSKLDILDTINPSIETHDRETGNDIYPKDNSKISYVSDSATIQSPNGKAVVTIRTFDRMVNPDRGDMISQATEKLSELGYNSANLMDWNIDHHPGILVYPEKGLDLNKFVAVTWLAEANGAADTNIAIESEFPFSSGEGTTQTLLDSLHFVRR